MAYVILVEDDRSISGLVCGLLVDEGHHVTALVAVSDALDAARKGRPDVVLLDVAGMDTEHAVCGLRALHPGLPIVLFTALGPRQLEPMLAELPEDVDTLYKPFEIDELLSCVGKAARRMPVR